MNEEYKWRTIFAVVYNKIENKVKGTERDNNDI